MAGLSGGSPDPPATITMSFPTALSRGHPVPFWTEPLTANRRHFAERLANLAGGANLCTRRSRCSTSPAMEFAASPMPKRAAC